jgi:hypothetical protein
MDKSAVRGGARPGGWQAVKMALGGYFDDDQMKGQGQFHEGMVISTLQ